MQHIVARVADVDAFAFRLEKARSEALLDLRWCIGTAKHTAKGMNIRTQAFEAADNKERAYAEPRIGTTVQLKSAGNS